MKITAPEALFTAINGFCELRATDPADVADLQAYVIQAVTEFFDGIEGVEVVSGALVKMGTAEWQQGVTVLTDGACYALNLIGRTGRLRSQIAFTILTADGGQTTADPYVAAWDLANVRTRLSA